MTTRDQDFSEAVKKEAKDRAHHHCVVCRTPGYTEVHHIRPQKDGGSDELDNAAPLCPNCHTLYGGNPDMRKSIEQMRDFWWQHCTRVAANPSMTATYERLDGLQAQLTGMREADEARHKEVLEVAKQVVSASLREQATRVSSAKSAREVMLASGISVAPDPFTASRGWYDRVPPFPIGQCASCHFALFSQSEKCPHCGAPLEWK